MVKAAVKLAPEPANKVMTPLEELRMLREQNVTMKIALRRIARGCAGEQFKQGMSIDDIIEKITRTDAGLIASKALQCVGAAL